MVRVEPTQLEEFARRGLESMGVPSEAAGQIGESLVLANIRGHHSHGIRRITAYDTMVSEGRIDPEATPSIERETANIAILDGNSAFGQLGGRKVTKTLQEKAEEQGMAAVGIRDATHMGRIGEWAEQLTDAGFLFLAFVNGQSDGSVALPGTTDGHLFTNPLAFGVPTFDVLEFPIVLDFATSQVANGKIKEHRAADKDIPVGWAVTPDGNPQTDPTALLDGDGAILPLGGLVSGYKGYGLAIIADLFAGILSNGLVANQSDNPYSNAGAFMAIDPGNFSTESAIAAQIRALRDHVQSATPHDGLHPGFGAKGNRVLLPGEAEYLTSQDHLREGIEIDERDFEILCEFAERLQISLPQSM